MTRYPSKDDLRSSMPSMGSAAAILAAGVGLAAGFVLYDSVKTAAGGRAPRAGGDSAPGRTSRQRRYGDYAVVGRSVTINRPRNELYSFWRDFQNLPRFMENIEKVDSDGAVSVWQISAPAGRHVTLRTRVVEDRQDNEISWESVEGSDVETRGKVEFRDAPQDRGTIVEAIISYKPPAGEAGRLLAKIFQKEPSIQTRRDLKRLKMLMETGEIATSHNRKAA